VYIVPRLKSNDKNYVALLVELLDVWRLPIPKFCCSKVMSTIISVSVCMRVCACVCVCVYCIINGIMTIERSEKDSQPSNCYRSTT